jgi:hypothetical protein
VEGNPSPHVWLTKDNTLLQNGGGTYVIPDANIYNEGTYYCHARNNLSYSNASFELNLHGKVVLLQMLQFDWLCSTNMDFLKILLLLFISCYCELELPVYHSNKACLVDGETCSHLQNLGLGQVQARARPPLLTGL